MNRRRLEAEPLWDAIHSVAGTLNEEMGGRPVMPPLAGEEQTDKANWVVNADPKQHTRRGLYILVRCNFRFPLFDIFRRSGERRELRRRMCRPSHRRRCGYSIIMWPTDKAGNCAVSCAKPARIRPRGSTARGTFVCSVHRLRMKHGRRAT